MRLFSPLLCAAALAASSTLSAGLAVAHGYKVGSLSIDHPWTRATPPGAPTAGGYLTLRNAGSAGDRLTGGSSPAADKVEIHEMKVADGVMTMRPLPDGVAVPAGGELPLKPGSYHLMLIGLKAPLREGERVPLTLIFETAGRVEVELAVEKMGAGEPHHGAAEHRSADHGAASGGTVKP